MSSGLEYAAKFVCGRTEETGHGEGPERKEIAEGDYHTAINVHNPTQNAISIRVKSASTQANGKPGEISRFAEIKMGPDEAISLGCTQIHELLGARAGFVDGFAVIESGVELDVVAVYTTSGERGRVETLDTARVPVRKVR